MVVVGYELGPDGAQFSQPVTLKVSVDPADHGLDLPEGAVPPALLLTENAAGDLESIEGEVSYEAGEIMVRATVTHFSPAIIVFEDDTALLEPSKIELGVGGSREVEVVTRDLGTGKTIALPRSLDRDEVFLDHDSPLRGGSWRVGCHDFVYSCYRRLGAGRVQR